MSAPQQILMVGNEAIGDVDASFSYVVLLLHFDGVDASTTFTDSSIYGDTSGAAQASAQIDTGQSKWGGSSLSCDNNSTAAVWFDDHARFGRGTSDWTIECWVRFSASATQERFGGQVDSTGANGNCSFALRRNGANKIEASVFSASTQYVVTSTASVGAGVWAHIAFVRDGANLHLFINGGDQQTTAIGAAAVNDSAYKYGVGSLGEFIGGGSGRDPLYGHIDDWRDTIGTARYTGSFTPPAMAFPDE